MVIMSIPCKQFLFFSPSFFDTISKYLFNENDYFANDK